MPAAATPQPSQPNGTSTPRTAPVARADATPTPASTPANPVAASTETAKPSPATPAGNPFAAAAKANPWAVATKPTASSPFAQSAQQHSPFSAASQGPKPSPFTTASTTTPSQANGNAIAQPAPAPAPAPTPRSPTAPDRYQIIHKNLKELRKSMLEQTKINPALKARMGDMRREIRKCVGQLVNGAPGAGQNKTQVRQLNSSSNCKCYR
jgi:nucleoporin GLE1